MAMEAFPFVLWRVMPPAILAADAEGGKAGPTHSGGTALSRPSFGTKEVVKMIAGIFKALLTPVLLGLGVALLIRMFAGRRGH